MENFRIWRRGWPPAHQARSKSSFNLCCRDGSYGSGDARQTPTNIQRPCRHFFRMRDLCAFAPGLPRPVWIGCVSVRMVSGGPTSGRSSLPTMAPWYSCIAPPCRTRFKAAADSDRPIGWDQQYMRLSVTFDTGDAHYQWLNKAFLLPQAGCPVPDGSNTRPIGLPNNGFYNFYK
jgi:hypothetical protein